MNRDQLIHCARAYLAQSRHFSRMHRRFSFVLLQWAANCRRDAMGVRTEPVQGDLFA